MEKFRLICQFVLLLSVILIMIQYLYFRTGSKWNSHIVLYENKEFHRKESLFYFYQVYHDLANNGSFKSTKHKNHDLAKIVYVWEKELSNNQNDSFRSLQESSELETSLFAKESNNTVGSAPRFCPIPSPFLLGLIKVNFSSPPFSEIAMVHEDLQFGGYYKPPDCVSKDKIAIILPYRDREEHLRTFLFNIHPILKRQMLEYSIFVIEQAGAADEPFNRGMLFNVGYKEALKRSNYTCFVFHDVDLIPENDKNLYNCPIQPRHMSVAVDKLQYVLPYKSIVGGVCALTTEQFKVVNGFSNMYWGWGGEDDDFSGRLAYKGYYISRPPPSIGRYKMLKHKHQKMNNNRFKMLRKARQRFRSDGLTSLKYSVDQLVYEKTYTLIRVVIKEKMDRTRIEE